MELPDPSTLRIVEYPDPVLRKICVPVESFGPDLAEFAAGMLRLMRESPGVGLSAPQVGVPIRLLVCNATGDPEDDLVCVNPRFLELSGAEDKEEGCLSLPEVGVTMRRATRAVMEAHRADGEAYRITMEDLVARICQHEADHLDGKMIIDNMSETDVIANRRAIKDMKDKCAAATRRR